MKNINDCVRDAMETNVIIPGFNVFGHEDALAVVRAAERAGSPVLLMVNKDARTAMDVAHWGALLSSIAGQAGVPVGVHLDHCTEKDVIERAMRSGFTSVMYDGSKLPIGQNIKNTREIVLIAHESNISVEGEVGFIPYHDLGEKPAEFSSPEEAYLLHKESKLDWLAVSVGNIHRLTDTKATIDFKALRAIEKACGAPLVIHGASGISDQDMQELKKTKVAKVNIGTALRMVFGHSLRKQLEADPLAFDRLALFKEPIKNVEEKAYELMVALK